jgi:NAD(P)H-dependent flavin oxidoreductase YrpB (nitropropane dioxygenase family)
MLGAAGARGEQLERDIAAAREAAAGAGGAGAGAVGSGSAACIGANFLMPFLDVAAFEAASAAADVVECFYGDPDTSVVARGHAGGALVSWQIGSLDEAVAAVDVGCDFVVVQGIEGGGHIRGNERLLPLLASVRDAIGTRVPLVAAGGIGSGDAMARALSEGADAVRIGTVLLATSEADVHPEYLRALLAAGASDTVLTTAFSGGWPDAPHRVLRACVDASDADPASRWVTPPTRAFAGDVASAAMYAGESVEYVHDVRGAVDVVEDLAASALARLRES